MSKVQIWHNPRCSKSREGLKYLEQKGVEVEVKRYLDDPASKEQIEGLLKKLGINARELMRTNEAVYKELKLKDVDDEELLIEAMAKYPKLIQRAVVIYGSKAVIARPAQKIDELLDCIVILDRDNEV